DDALPKTAVPAQVMAALDVAPANRTPEQEDLLFDYWRTTEPEFREANLRIDALYSAVPSGETQLVLLQRDHPRQTYRLDRGDFLSPAEEVEPGVPGFLHPLQTTNAVPNRLDFAR